MERNFQSTAGNYVENAERAKNELKEEIHSIQEIRQYNLEWLSSNPDCTDIRFFDNDRAYDDEKGSAFATQVKGHIEIHLKTWEQSKGSWAWTEEHIAWNLNHEMLHGLIDRIILEDDICRSCMMCHFPFLAGLDVLADCSMSMIHPELILSVQTLRVENEAFGMWRI